MKKNDLDWTKIKISKNMANFIKNMPKTSLHMHIEGSLEPDLAWELAKKAGYGKNKPLKIPKPKNGFYSITTLNGLKKVYNFDNLESFLNIYNTLATLLKTTDDFTKLAQDYAQVCIEENIKHAEIFFDPQTHIKRGIAFEDVVNGLQLGLQKARDKGLSITLIACILRDHAIGTSADVGDISSTDYNIETATAWATANCIVNYNKLCKNYVRSSKERPRVWSISGIGIDNNEVGFPPDLFIDIYNYLRENKLFCVAHAGEEGGVDYIWQAINNLKVVRIDHGVKAIYDPSLLVDLSTPKIDKHILRGFSEPHVIPLTVCPLSNYKLQLFSDPTQTNILKLLDLGIMTTVNSDDPAYFGGHTTENYLFLLKALHPKVTKLRPIKLADIFRLAQNGFNASIINQVMKKQYLKELAEYFLVSPGDLYKKLINNK